ncbi:MAG: NAD(P)-dependent oxidoreductase [Acidimicrobiia bacterium]|nr:NAD(P)-dependent oxidoreductase [Acidimicrobiia bacterium]
MRSIVVTGGSGKAGKAVVRDLVEAGYRVVNVDVAATRDPDAPDLIADLTDLGQTWEVLKSADAVVHLAAVPAPNILPDGETFRINTLSTYNVFSVAVELGLEKVVWASSETLLGIPFERHDPSYAPLDEQAPPWPEFHYALAKLMGEVLADQFARWSGIPFVSLRYSNVMDEADYARFPGFWDKPLVRAWNLWGYVDARDVARCTRLALEGTTTGHEVFLVAADDSCMTTPSADLMADVYPDVEYRANGRGEFETLLSIDKAKRILGYVPAHSWRDYVDA